jgi:hypothetical protein
MDLTEIMRAVYRVYPKTEREKTCVTEKQKRDELRKLLKQRLIDEARDKYTVGE